MERQSVEFEWRGEYDDLLEQIAASDTPDIEWPRLRDMIKYKIRENIRMFLVQGDAYRPPTPPPPGPLPGGGQRLPPFSPRDSNPNGAPKKILTAQEAVDFKDLLYKILDDFDGPPFTIQRLCELCLQPRKHYNYIGKYLRAIEKTLLVTSTWNAFPASSEDDPSTAAAAAAFSTISIVSSAPTTPMFSPIPFLHQDARRSSSRSPPPSPLVLPALKAGGTSTSAPHTEGTEPKALGLVDELDDPSPGHLSKRPYPLTVTTSMKSTPVIRGLQDRFVKESGSESGEAPKVEGEERDKESATKR